MSRFYGTVQGQRGEATRCGNSGIRASAQSWDGSVIVALTYRDDDPDALHVRIEAADHSSSYGERLWSGSFDEFKRILTNAR